MRLPVREKRPGERGRTCDGLPRSLDAHARGGPEVERLARVQPHRGPLLHPLPDTDPALLDLEGDATRAPLEDLAARIRLHGQERTLQRIPRVRHTLCTTCVHVIALARKSTSRMDKTLMLSP